MAARKATKRAALPAASVWPICQPPYSSLPISQSGTRSRLVVAVAHPGGGLLGRAVPGIRADLRRRPDALGQVQELVGAEGVRVHAAPGDVAGRGPGLARADARPPVVAAGIVPGQPQDGDVPGSGGAQGIRVHAVHGVIREQS